tara:strand:+ start:478 stop:870 length:393 start_codon:yes stop_codon:yes gene_type:complete
MSNEYNTKSEKKSEILSNIKVIKIFAITLGILIIIGLVVLFFGLAKGFNKLEESKEKKVYPINIKQEKISKYALFHPPEAQLISSSLGLDDEILLRFMFKGNNILVTLDKNTKQYKSIITFKKKENAWKE